MTNRPAGRPLNDNQVTYLRSYVQAGEPGMPKKVKPAMTHAQLVRRGLISEQGALLEPGKQWVAYADDRDARIEKDRARKAAARATVAAGVCPCCGAGLRRNLSLTGWWQCEQLGAVGFRKDASKPSCSWQTFID